ncbi:PKD domain-containing protein [Microbacteriaceae bacterium 4G12]
MLHFYPTFNTGSVSGANQGPWSVTGAGDYVVYGGEFTTVNGRRQQGLARFRTTAQAPNTDGPRLSGSGWEPNVVSLSTGSVRVAWPANYDRDNASLTYRVIRDGNNAAPVFETTAESTPWKQPPLGYLDTGLEPGSSHTYRIRAEDPFGNVAWSSIVPVTVSAEGTLSAYAAEVLADQPTSYWRLGETDGATAYDWASYSDAVVGTGVTRGATGAINDDRNAASGFPGNNTGLVATKTLEPGPNTFAVETWFKTTSTTGGKLVGFGNANTGNSSSYDRHVYLDGSGRVIFGVYPNAERTISSGAGLNDGAWHHVVANLGPTGMQLYVDGKRVAQRVDTTGGQAYDGYWRIGGDSSWGGTAQYFTGTIDDVAIYSQPLTGAEVDRHYTLSGRPSALPAAPTDPYGAQIFNDSPDLYWRLNETGGTVAKDSSAGDSPGVYQGGVTKQQLGAVAGTTDASAQFDGSTGVVVSSRQVNNPQVYSAELWFNSTTTEGGKLIGFGSAQTGTSGNYDRHVYLQPDGRLVFGTWTGSANTVTTPRAYNDGGWHHMVATMSSAGLRLYVDGALQASNSNGGAQGYAGYWRIGGDTTWGSAPYVNARIDEAAVYSTALTAEQVAQHHRLGVGEKPNAAPVASFSSEVSALSVSVDAADSADSDGSIRSYAWDFGDGTTATGAMASHRYTTVGTYTVRLTVTDDDGATAEMSREVSVVAPVENAAPVAAFSADVSALSLSVDAADSADSDGSIQSYAWDFGDGGSATGVTAVHRYAAAGTYTVRLTVTDDDGSTGTSTSTVTVAPLPPENVAPVASFSAEASELSLAVDASGSSDSDGSIQSYAWDFGDGGTATEATASHRYAAAGTYTVTLTVTDDDGAGAVTSREVSVVAAPANVAPVASFSAQASELSVAVDGSGSSDSDGSIRSYAWDFGDGGSATGATATHRYAAAGTYPVQLTVTDDDGATASSTRTVSVTAAPVAQLLASDVFERSTANGLGSADIGGAWTLGSAASNYSVSGGVGRLATPSGSTRNAYLQSVSSADTEVQVTAAITQPVTGSGAYVSAIARRTTAGEYLGRVKVLADGSTSVQVMRDSTSLQNVALPGVRFAAGERMQIRVQATGVSPTTVRAKVWPLGAAEPDAWQVSATDATAGLQQAGSIGLRSYLSGSAGSPIAFTFDGLKVGAPGSFGTAEPTPNATPIAAFSADASELAVTVDASASSDSDGSIASYAWRFGDGGSGTGLTAAHRYAAAGTYAVTLTVTDDRGATATSTSTVTVAAAPVSALLASDAFERSVTNGLGSADAGGAWTLGSTASNFSVSSGVGRFGTPAGSTRSAYLRDVSSTDTDARVTATLQQPVTGSGAYVSVLARRTDAGEYLGRVKVLPDGSASIQVMRDGTSLRNVTVPGLRFSAGDRMEIRVQAFGVSPTTVRAKVWAAGTAEPDAWQASATDATAGLQVAGHIGLRSYLSGTATGAVTVAFDGLAVEKL